MHTKYFNHLMLISAQSTCISIVCCDLWCIVYNWEHLLIYIYFISYYVICEYFEIFVFQHLVRHVNTRNSIWTPRLQVIFHIIFADLPVQVLTRNTFLPSNLQGWMMNVTVNLQKLINVIFLIIMKWRMSNAISLECIEFSWTHWKPNCKWCYLFAGLFESIFESEHYEYRRKFIDSGSGYLFTTEWKLWNSSNTFYYSFFSYFWI